MGLFTTVITYSKYISSLLDEGDSARVSKFNIQLKYCSDTTCEDATSFAPKPNTYRPFDDMVYYFAIDSSNLEVNADLILMVQADRHFKIKEIKEVVEDDVKDVENISKNDTGKTMSISRTVKAQDPNLIKYRAVLVYDSEVIDYNSDGSVRNGVIKENDVVRYIFDESQEFHILSVVYSAEQSR